MLTLMFLAVYAVWAWFHVTKTKPLAWMVANAVVLAAGAFLCWHNQNVYFLVGAFAAVGFVAYQALAVKLPLLANWTSYAKLVVSSLLFWPVGVFEEVYNYLSPKL